MSLYALREAAKHNPATYIAVIVIASITLIIDWAAPGANTPAGGKALPYVATAIGCCIAMGLAFLGMFLSQQRFNGPIARRNADDYRLAHDIESLAAGYSGEVHKEVFDGNALIARSDLELGELIRRFDQTLQATIDGWLEHDLSFHGWGLGVATSRVGIGLGQLGLAGASSLHAQVAGTIRSDLTGDGFVAVLEFSQGGRLDSLRLVVPSDAAQAQMVAGFLNRLGVIIGSDTYSDQVLTRLAQQLTGVGSTASYVSDRLNALLRTPADRRPKLTVGGIWLKQHILLGAFVQIGNEDPARLLPLELMHELSTIVARFFSLNDSVATLLVT